MSIDEYCASKLHSEKRSMYRGRTTAFSEAALSVSIPYPVAQGNVSSESVFTTLLPELRQALVDSGYCSPTPIQALAIPTLIKGRDLLACAQTGTGKTAAFILPILQHIARKKGKINPLLPRVVMIAPTRESAMHIGDSIANYGRHLNIDYSVIVGGVSQQYQINELRRGVDIVVATPGRFLDFVNCRHLCLRSIEVFVVDEVDRMFDMDSIRHIR